MTEGLEKSSPSRLWKPGKMIELISKNGGPLPGNAADTKVIAGADVEGGSNEAIAKTASATI